MELIMAFQTLEPFVIMAIDDNIFKIIIFTTYSTHSDIKQELTM